MSSMTALPGNKGENEPHVVWLPASGNDSEGTTLLANAGVASAHLKPGTVYARIVGRDFEFTMNEHMRRVTIGRQSDCSDVDVKIGLSSFISRRHVEIYRVDDEEGGGEYGRVRFFIVSTGKNGIFINGIYQRLGADAMELPKICTLRFPSTTVKLLFQEVVVGGVTAAPIPAEANSSESEVDKASKVDGSPSQLSTSIASAHLPVPVSTLPSSPVRPPPDPLRLASPVLPDVRSRLEHHRATMEFEPVPPDHMKPGSRKRPAEASAKSRSSKLVIDEQNGRSQFSDKDFSHDNYGKSKPPYSYAQLIAQAIASSTDHQLTLNDIYSFISQRYPYYKATDKGWQNSIRHNLSLNHCFIRVARSQDEPGKGSYWRIDPTAEKKMCEQAFRRRNRNAGPAAGDHKFRHQDSLDSVDADWKMDHDDYDDDIPTDQSTGQLVGKLNIIEQSHNSGDGQHQLTQDAEPAGTTMVALPAVSSPCTASLGLSPKPSLSVQRADPDTRVPSEQLVSPGAVHVSPTLLQSGSIIQPIQGQSQAVIRQILQRAVLISQTSQPGNGCLPVLTVPGVASLPRQQFQFVLGTARPTFIGPQTSFASRTTGSVERHPAAATTMVRTDGQNSTPAPLHHT